MLNAVPPIFAAAALAAAVLGAPWTRMLVAAVVSVVIVVAALRIDARGPGTDPATQRLLPLPVMTSAGIVGMFAAASCPINVVGWGLLAVAAAVATILVLLEVG